MPGFLLTFAPALFAQAEKYANIDVFPDSQILTYLQKAFPNDKLNYYDVKLNGRMQHVKNYYDYISFRCVLTDSIFVTPVSPSADTLHPMTPDSSGAARDSAALRPESSRPIAPDSISGITPDRAGRTQVKDSSGISANNSSRLAAVLAASNDIALSDNNVLAKREVDSTWVLADTLISARRGITHPTEKAVPAISFTDSIRSATSYVITSDTIVMINCGANAEHRPSLVWIYHSKDPSTHIVIGAGDFREEMLMLQNFCDGLGPKLSAYQVEIWDLFVKSHQGAMYTPVYDHEAHYNIPQ